MKISGMERIIGSVLIVIVKWETNSSYTQPLQPLKILAFLVYLKLQILIHLKTVIVHPMLQQLLVLEIQQFIRNLKRLICINHCLQTPSLNRIWLPLDANRSGDFLGELALVFQKLSFRRLTSYF